MNVKEMFSEKTKVDDISYPILKYNLVATAPNGLMDKEVYIECLFIKEKSALEHISINVRDELHKVRLSDNDVVVFNVYSNGKTSFSHIELSVEQIGI